MKKTKLKVIWLAPYPINTIPGINQFITKSADIYGKGTWLYNLAHPLSAQDNIELHIITYSSKITNDLTVVQDQINFYIIKYAIPFINKGFPQFFPWHKMTWYARLTSKIMNLVDELKPDIVHAHGTEDAYALCAIRSRYPYIITLQGIIKDYFKASPSIPHYFQKQIERYTIKNGRIFGGRTLYDNNFVTSINANAKVFYCPEAINPTYFDTSWKPDKTSPEILFIGSVCDRKGVKVLIDAFIQIHKKIKDLKLVMIGSGNKSYIEQIREKLIRDNCDHKVHFLGFLKPEEIAANLAHASVFVLPTYMDNSPNSLIEAMAVGVPIVTTDVGGIPSIITDGVNGLLVPSREPEKLASTILYILENAEKSAQFSINAKETAFERSYPPNVVKTMTDVYYQAIDQFKG